MSKRRRTPVRAWIVGLLAVYGVAFVLLNNDEIELNFVFFKQTASLVVALILIGALGFALGFLAHLSRGRNGNKAD